MNFFSANKYENANNSSCSAELSMKKRFITSGPAPNQRGDHYDKTQHHENMPI